MRCSSVAECQWWVAAEGNLKSDGDRRGDVPLQLDNVAHLVLMLLRPHVRLAFDVDELSGDPI